MTIELYLLIGVTFVFFMEHFHGDHKYPDIGMFLVLLFLASIWPVTLVWLLGMNITDWARNK